MEHSSQQIFRLLDEKTSYFKSSEQMAPIVRVLFASPTTLVQKFNQLSAKNLNNRNHDFDIESIQRVYQNIKKLKLSKQIAKCLMEIADKFEQKGNLEQYVKSQKDMKFFFFVILWEQLFTSSENSLLLLKMLNLINACPGYTNTFENWAKQLDQHYVTLIIGQLHKYLERQCQKLPAQLKLQINQQNEYVNKLWLNISNICKFMRIIYHSNLEHKRVPKQVFILPTLSKYFDVEFQFKLHHFKISKMNILDFPFLMQLDYKYDLLRIESVLEQKLTIQKSMASGFSGMISAMIQNGGDFSLEGLIYLYLQVNRHDILNDSMEKLGKVKNLKSPLRISFVGQEGSDEGGVKNEYFQLITKAIFNPYLDMFLPKHNGRVYWFNGFSYEPPIRFQFVGMLLGLAIYNQVHLNIPFPNVLYKKLLNRKQDDDYSPQLIDDLFDIQPDTSKGLKKILQTQEDLDCLELYFTIELQNFGEKVVEQLVEEGREIKVTQDNKQEYCQLIADYQLNKHIKKQFDAFKRGFYKVVSGRMIELFDPEDLRTIIYGNDVIDFKELEQTTTYEGGYTKDTPIIKNLWQILHSLDVEDKKAFLVFTTGSDRVPIEGLKQLNFVIQKHADSKFLPTAHTCFNVFLLPEYETKEKLEKMIQVILKNNQGFGLI